MKYEEILSEAHNLQPWLSQIRRELHSRAEVGFELPRTTEHVRACLDEMGLEYRCCGKAGIIAELGSGERCFLLRADMDALPMGDGTACHACGHDMHTAMLLGAAKLLKKRALNGRVRLMFQPAEELLEGAKDMVAHGALEGVSGAMMLHVMSGVPYKTGTVLLPKAGVSAPAADFFELRLQGRGCHGSMPDKGFDPIAAAAHVLTALHVIRAREIPGNARSALTVGSIHGGSTPNVIPDQVLLEGSLRAFEEEVRSFMKKRLEDISSSVAAAFRVQAKLSFTRGCPGLLIDADLRSLAICCAREMGLELLDAPQDSSGSEDFAYVSREVPTVMAALAAGNSEEGYTYPLHHPAVRFDEAALPTGAALMAAMALEF